MRRLSRRKFFGLVGCAAAAAALPKPLLGELEPAVGAGLPVDESVYFVTAHGVFQYSDIEATRISDSLGGYVCGMPYWLVAEDGGLYLGIERTAKP